MDECLIPVCTLKYLSAHAFLRRPKDVERCTLLHDGQPWVGASADAEWRHWLNESGTAGIRSDQGPVFSVANMSIEAALSHQGIATRRASLIRELLETGDSRHRSTGELVAPSGIFLWIATSLLRALAFRR